MVLQLANPNAFSKTIIIPIHRLIAGAMPPARQCLSLTPKQQWPSEGDMLVLYGFGSKRSSS